MLGCLIVKPTESCNLDCKYCLRTTKSSAYMSSQTLEKLYLRLAEYPFKRLRIIWHGGEPLTAGIGFYERAMALQKEYLPDRTVINSIQTNGTLINDSWCHFFNENRFSVGVSLDGDKAMNADRIYPDGKDAVSDIIKGIDLLRIHHVKYGLLAVISNSIIGREKAFYRFFKKHTHSLRINFVVPYGVGKDNVAFSYEEYLDALGDSIIKLYNIWKKDHSGKELFSILPFSEIVRSLINGRVNTCSFSDNGCHNVLSLGHDGSLYSCGRLAEDEEFAMGNINDCTFEEALDSAFGQMRRKREQHIIAECGDCEFLNICHGGCAQEAYALSGDYFKKTPFCTIFKRLFTHVKDDLKAINALP